MLRKRAIVVRRLRADTDPDDRKVSAVCALACALLLGALIIADKTVMADASRGSAACAASIGQQVVPHGSRALSCEGR